MREADDEGPGLWTSFGAALRLIVGWFSVTIGLLDLLVEVDRTGGPPDTAYLLFHVVLVVGGILLLAGAWLGRDPGVAGFVAGGVVAAAGMIAAAVPVTNTVCCLSGFDVRHGFPFSFVARDNGEPWHLDGEHLVADLLFWGYAGLFALVVVALVRRSTANRPADAPVAPRPHTHAEARAHAAERARREQPADD